jgi:lactate 2-monooxygenase
LQDAEQALEAGADGLVISNHGGSLRSSSSYHPDLSFALSGGRQVDGAVASLFALEQICRSPKIREAQQGGKLTVLFDSGIRTGSDIMKALALGAQAILCQSPVSSFVQFVQNVRLFSGETMGVWSRNQWPGRN